MNYKVSTHLSWRDIQGQVLILDPRINQKAHELNPIASYIWSELSQGQDSSTIIEDLENHYEGQVQTGQIETHVQSFIDQLLSLELISHDI